MMRWNQVGVLLLVAGGTAACGYTDGGGGTHTLEVVARLSYSPDDNRTTARIQVEKSNLPVEGATVVIKDGDETFEIPQHNTGSSEYFRNDITGYHRRVELRVEFQDDRLDGKLEGPGRHTITSPVNNEAFSRSKVDGGLKVRWTTNDGIAAEEVTLRLREGDFSTTLVGHDDPGEFKIPGSALTEGNDSVSVTRRNTVELSGGVGGSMLESEYHVSNGFVVE